MREAIDKMGGTFVRHTSPHDWCERNYVHSDYVAEYYNTLSNLPFIAIAAFQLYLCQSYAKHVTKHIVSLWILMAFVGFGSAYYHATLSLAGQIIDELSIFYLIMGCTATIVPRWRYSRPCLLGYLFHGDAERWRTVFYTIMVIGTFLSWLAPALNAAILLTFSFPLTVHLVQDLNVTTSSTTWRLSSAMILWWILAVAIWIMDKYKCEELVEMFGVNDFPYPEFHAWWHIGACVSAYSAIVLAQLSFAHAEAPELNAQIRYYPWSLSSRYAHVEFGIPFIKLELPATAKKASPRPAKTRGGTARQPRVRGTRKLQ